jgi:hypothetical protein
VVHCFCNKVLIFKGDTSITVMSNEYSRYSLVFPSNQGIFKGDTSNLDQRNELLVHRTVDRLLSMIIDDTYTMVV